MKEIKGKCQLLRNQGEQENEECGEEGSGEVHVGGMEESNIK